MSRCGAPSSIHGSPTLWWISSGTWGCQLVGFGTPPAWNSSEPAARGSRLPIDCAIAAPSENPPNTSGPSSSSMSAEARRASSGKPTSSR